MTAKFELEKLGWHDFQHLCHTVASVVLGQTVMLFSDSNDGGRDGAFYGTWKQCDELHLSGKFVIQAKHTSKRDGKLSKSKLSDEVRKAQRLSTNGMCDIYVLMTNARVSGPLQEWFEYELHECGIEHVLIFGSEWFNHKISINRELRALVPRLYGLGDLTEILDEKAYRQAKAVLDNMRPDLAKLVRTRTYESATTALRDHGIALILGAPMAGKTALAAQLALAAADLFETQVVMLDSTALVQEYWNPDEKQFFWLDDVFGATQLVQSRALAWQASSGKIKAAIDNGSKFVLTSRGYIYNAARSHLKPGTLPLSEEAHVLVKATDLDATERRQILYNHLKHSSQKKRFLRQIQPHLELLADHERFMPELARRLAEPLLTKQMGLPTRQEVLNFFEQPTEMLEEILFGLDDDSKSALGLIYISNGWLESPVQLHDAGRELVDRLGGTLGGLTAALNRMDGSLVVLRARDGRNGWTFSHPTMHDAFTSLVHNSEFLHLAIHSFGTDVLLDSTSCGDVGIENSLLVPESLWPIVMDKIHPSVDQSDNWWLVRQRQSYVAYNCVPSFQAMYLERFPNILEDLVEPMLPLEENPNCDFLVALHRHGVLPETARQRFAARIIELCVSGFDFAAMWSESLRSVLDEYELKQLSDWLSDEVLVEPFGIVDNFLSGYQDDDDPDYYSEPLKRLARFLADEYAHDQTALDAATEIEDMREDWLNEVHSNAEPDLEVERDYRPSVSRQPDVLPSRSVFDDLV